MTKHELISALAQKGNYTRKEAESALEAVASVIAEGLVAGEKIHLPGVGTLEVRDRKEKLTKNPRTHEPMVTPAKRAPVFRAAKALKEAVNRNET